MTPEDGTRQQRHAGSDGAAGVDIGGGGVYDGDARHAPQQQLTGIRHGGTERRLIRHRAEYRRQRLRLPQTADAAGLRRAVRQRDAALQPGLQRPDLGGVYAAAVLRAVHRHHGAGDYDDLTLCIGQRLLSGGEQPGVEALHDLPHLVLPRLVTHNKKPLSAAGRQLLCHPGQYRAKQDRPQHQRFVTGGAAALQIQKYHTTIHGNPPPLCILPLL